MGKCCECGILMREPTPFLCYRYGTKLSESEISMERDCPYFTKPLYDGEEPLAPAQLVLLKEQDMKMRKMQGPV